MNEKTTEIEIESGRVIKALQEQLAEAHWKIAILKAQLAQALFEKDRAEQDIADLKATK